MAVDRISAPSSGASAGTRVAACAGAAVVAVAAAIGAVWTAASPGDVDEVLAQSAMLVLGTAFAASGCRLAVRVPRHRYPWLLLAGGAALDAAGTLGAAGAPDAIWYRVWIPGGLALLPLATMLFPDGRLPRIAGVPAAATIVGAATIATARPEAAVVGTVGLANTLALISAIWARFETSDSAARRQLLWVVLAVGGSSLVAGLAEFLQQDARGAVVAAVTCTVVALAIPTAFVVGGLQPDAGDIRATIVEASLFVMMALLAVAVFVGVASTYLALVGVRPSDAGMAVIAFAVAVCFEPARVVLRGVVDRLIFGDRAQPIDAASRVGEVLGDDPVWALRALRQALVLPYAAIVQDDREIARSGTLTTDADEVPLTLGGKRLGRLVVGLRPGELRLSADDIAALNLVAPALAQALHARTLSSELERSRGRVVASREEERRRLRRDLHDGLGPTLTGVAYAADAARNVMAADPATADALLAQLRDDTARAIVEVRRLVEGLRPPALDELGLVEALRGQAARMRGHDAKPLTVTVVASGAFAGLPAAVEVAAFRIVTEALTNVSRHSSSERADVRLTLKDGVLVIDVADAGSFANWTPGVGMSSMAERASEVGGTCVAGPTPSGGRVHAELPVVSTR
jgi:signal transduction histidine kinase